MLQLPRKVLLLFVSCLFLGSNLWATNSNTCATDEASGDSCLAINQTDKAIYFYEKALTCSKDAGLLGQQLSLSVKIGNGLASINDNVKAMKYFLSALNLAGSKYNNQKVQAYLGIASLKMKSYNFDDAISYLRKVENLYEKNPKLPLAYRKEYLQMLGVSFAGQGKVEQALVFFQACEELYFKSEKDANYGGILNNIGAIYSKQNDLVKSSEYYAKALNYFESSRNELGVAVTNCNIAYLHQKKREFNEAIALYEKAIKVFHKENSYFYLSNNYLNMVDIYKELGKERLALKYFELSVKYDELNRDENQDSSINNLEMQFAIHKKNQEIKIIEQENELKRNRQQIMIILLISALGFIFLVYLNLRNNLQKTRLKKELAEKESKELGQEILLKEKDLEILALKIIEKNQFLDKVKGDLADSQDADGADRAKINTIKQDILHNINIDKERLEFEMQIDQLQASFISKLELQHGHMTKTEKRLCSLLLMDLSSKDMATIMNITEDSIKKSRNRLRKKLNLEQAANLTDYLKSL